MNPWVLFLIGLIVAPFLFLWWESRQHRKTMLHEQQALELANSRARGCKCGLLPVWHPSMQWTSFQQGGEVWHHSRDRCQPAREKML